MKHSSLFPFRFLRGLVDLFRVAAVLLMLASPLAAATPVGDLDLSVLETCLAAQKKIRSISAEFTQTRALRTLKSPIAIKGRFWFASPDRFRWELGEPAKTIIIGSRQGATILQPLKKRAEKVSFDSPRAAGVADLLRMMEMNSNQTVDGFQKQMRVLSLKNIGPHCRLEMLPKDPVAAKGLSSLFLDFDPMTGHWVGFEFVTKEGSSMRTEFTHVELNPKLDNSIFDCDLTGFAIDESAR